MREKLTDQVIFLLFFISGACGLIYEVIWGKYLSLFIGSTTYAHMIVLATFMGGLAAGSYVFGRVADRVTRPLKLYAWLEIGIGLYGALYSSILEYLQHVYFQVAANFQFGGVVHILSKLPLSFLTLILPTFLMGGTLPVLSKFFIPSLGKVGKKVAFLYFINSFGAVVGTLIAGFYLIERLGFKPGLVTTGIVNFAVGFTILVIESFVLRERAPAADQAADEEEVVLYEDAFVKLAMVGICLSGFTSMVYELVWVRMFAVILESSTYSFSLMLAAFIAGITVGSLIAGRVMASSRRYLLIFGLCELAITVSVIAGIPFYERLPYSFWKLRYLLKPVAETFFYYNLMKFFICFSIMFVPTLFFGMTLPLVSKIASTNLGQLAKKIGNVYAANTLGTLLGALSTGLLLIPVLGLKRSLEIGFGLNLVIALIVFARTPDIVSKRWRVVPALFGVLLVGVYGFVLPGWNSRTMALGLYRNRGIPDATYAAFKKSSLNRYQVRYYKEDVNNNVAVLAFDPTSKNPNLALTVNGKVDATTTGDVPTQILLGQIPLMMKPDARSVLIVGLGSGMTAGNVLTHRQVSSVDCIEISPAVADAVTLFAPYNNDVLKHPEFHLFIEDAKTYIKTTRKQYDIVISEPSNPWMAGVGNLFSVEFFRDVERILKPNGLVVQWFHRYEITDEIVATVVKTFNTVFPHAYIFQGNTTDLIMLGSKQRLAPDFAAIERKFQDPAVRRELAKIKVFDVPSLLALQILSAENIPKVTAIGAINSDYRPLIEYRAPLAFYVGETATLITKYDERLTTEQRLFLSQYFRAHPFTPEQHKHLIQFFKGNQTRNERLAYSLTEKYLTLRPDDTDMVLDFASESFEEGRQDYALKLIEGTLHEDDVVRMERYADLSYEARRPFNSIFNPQDFHDTIQYLQKCLAVSNQQDKYLIKLGQTYLVAGRYQEAIGLLMDAMRFRDANSKAPHFTFVSEDDLNVLIGRAYYSLGDYQKSQEYMNKAYRSNPRNVDAVYYRLVLMQVQRNKR